MKKAKTKGTSRAKKSPRSTVGARATADASASTASLRIDGRIRDLSDWRGETLTRMRALIRQADRGITEEWKWNNPVWSHDGIVCTGEAYAKVVKLTFARGEAVDDPAGLFNSSLGGKTRRAIDIHEGEKVDARAFKALVKAAVAANRTSSSKSTVAQPVKLLSGGNPQIAKADGDAPVQAYIAAMPGWKSDIGKRVDAIVERNSPRAHKAVRWNSPFYGIEGQGWFLSFHVLTRYIRVTFFSGMSLRPIPPGGTEKSKEARWIDIHEGEFDEAQMSAWVKQAAALPGWIQ